MRRSLVFLLIQIQATKIDNHIDSHFGQALKAFVGRLRAAIKSWRHFAEIWHTCERDSLGWRVSDCGMLRSGLGLKRRNRCTDAENNNYCSLQMADLSREAHEN